VKNRREVVLETFAPDPSQLQELHDFVFDGLPALANAGEIPYQLNKVSPDMATATFEVIALAPSKHRRPFLPQDNEAVAVWAQLAGKTLIRCGNTVQRWDVCMVLQAGETAGIYGTARRSFENTTKYPAVGVLLRIMDVA
jgi:hypothetical protein